MELYRLCGCKEVEDVSWEGLNFYRIIFVCLMNLVKKTLSGLPNNIYIHSVVLNNLYFFKHTEVQLVEATKCGWGSVWETHFLFERNVSESPQNYSVKYWAILSNILKLYSLSIFTALTSAYTPKIFFLSFESKEIARSHHLRTTCPAT